MVEVQVEVKMLTQSPMKHTQSSCGTSPIPERFTCTVSKHLYGAQIFQFDCVGVMMKMAATGFALLFGLCVVCKCACIACLWFVCVFMCLCVYGINVTDSVLYIVI